MNKIKKFKEFINEGFLDSKAAQIIGSIVTGRDVSYQVDPEDSESANTDSSYGENTGSSSLIVSSSIPGNDDFTLYMQHQQGLGGATGIIKALNGTGKMHPETLKTKKGVKYANLVMNVPSDRPQVKKDIINALDNGDQKTAASLFLNMWKDKWFGRQKYAIKAINEPKNSEVKDAIAKACVKYNIPFDFAVTVAMIESSLNPLSQGNTYKGLFAMVPSSDYEGSVTPMGDNWKDPYVNSEAGISLLAANIKKFKKSLGNDWASLSVGRWADNLAKGIATNSTQSFRNPSTPAGKSIVIGDSLSPNVAKCSQADLISSTAGPSSLWKGGIAIGTLLDYVNSYGKTDSTIKNVVISIGTNGIYGRSTDTVNKLMLELKKKFPNAKVLVVKGTYGPKATWSPALTKVSQTTVDNYYSDFSNKGAFIVPTAIGNQKDAHAYTDIYTTIGKEIDANLS